jgi:hypothetical protein
VAQAHQKSEAILRSARMLRTALRARLMSAMPLTGREGGHRRRSASGQDQPFQTYSTAAPSW